MNPSGSAPCVPRPGSRVIQFGVSRRSESQRSVRQELATSPRSSTTWSIAATAELVAHRQSGLAGADDHDGGAHAGARFAPALAPRQATSTGRSVGLVTMSNTAERFCDWATIASRSAFEASASMS